MNCYQVITIDKKSDTRTAHSVLAISPEKAKSIILCATEEVNILSVIKLFPVYGVITSNER